MGDGDPKAADGGSPGQDIWVLPDAIEHVCHGLPLSPLFRVASPLPHQRSAWAAAAVRVARADRTHLHACQITES